jgi:ATP-binding cassette, subfamily B, bacterial
MSPLPPGSAVGPQSALAERLAAAFRYALRGAQLVRASSPKLAAAYLVLVVVSGAAPVAIAGAGKRIVDAVVARDIRGALLCVSIELGLLALQLAATRAMSLVRQILGSRLGVDINQAILTKATKLRLMHFEDSEFYDRMTRARREASSRPVALLGDGLSLVQYALSLTGFLVVLAQYRAWVAVLVLAMTIPAAIAEVRFSKINFKLRNWRSPESRRLTYLEYVLANDEHAKEVRLLGLADYFLNLYRTTSEQFHREDAKLAWKKSWVTALLSLLSLTSLYVAYASVAWLAARGRLTLGEMTLYLLAFRQAQTGFQALLSAVSSIYEHNLYMSNLFGFLDADLVDTAGPESQTLPSVTRSAATNVAEAGHAAVEFIDVGFQYRGKTEWAVRHLNLSIPVQQKIALVGKNGAGKTTLVKLITGLYTPTEGSVRIDGVDTRDWEPAALRARFGVVFQDFNQYQLSLRDNVGLGDLRHHEDMPHVQRAAELGGADEVARALPGGFDAPLGHIFRGGVELSGGQWQKVALSRAFMKDDAKILILDEPTAALDAEAEYAVFQRVQQLALRATALLISHRLSTVRTADRIVVLEAGAVKEDGSHAELIAQGGIYAKLFRLQADGYA